jgi:CDP-glucose 4,6-dehydratase
MGVSVEARKGAHVPRELRGSGVDAAFWNGRRVLLTGHTGFKGSWLSLWLQLLGARVSGFGASAPTEPALYELAHVGAGMETVPGDIRDGQAVADAVARFSPEVVIHMAAQSLVRRSLAAPRETYDVNVGGTVNVLEAIRGARSVGAVVVVTSDKCYANPPAAGHGGGFREDDPLGGADPYSSSKAAAELVTAAYRSSFFAAPDAPRVACARAGNVIGGGDWAADRLLPDLMRAAMAGESALVRNPDAVRPWQHVLGPLSGYLVLAQALWSAPELARAWNFGPPQQDMRPVRWIADRVSALWPGGMRWEDDGRVHPPEAAHLTLDSSRATEALGWREPLSLEQALEATVDWYRAFAASEDVRALTVAQIEALEGARETARSREA